MRAYPNCHSTCLVQYIQAVEVAIKKYCNVPGVREHHQTISVWSGNKQKRKIQ
jgi:hypothetical protein